jgi:molybdate transport system permease protein
MGKLPFALPMMLVTFFYLAVLALTYQDYPPVRIAGLIATPEVRHAIFLSVATATIASVIAFALGIPTAYFLARNNFPGKAFVDALLDIPVFLSPIAVGALLLVAFSSSPGRWFQENVLEIVFEVPGIIVAQATIVTALAVRLMKATFESIPARYEKVARSLGCTEWMAFRKVILPLSRNGLIASAILVWARAVGEFGATVTLAGATELKTATIPTAIYLGFAGADINRALALVAILMLISILTLVGLRRIAGRTLEL